MNFQQTFLRLGFLIILFFHQNVYGEEFEKDENGIIILNDSNFQAALERYKTVVTLVYLKSDPKTKKVVKLIEKAGKLLKEESKDGVLAKLPLEYENTIFTKYNLEGSHGLLAVMDYGERFVEYTQTLDNETKIIEFLKKKIQDPIKEINDVAEIKRLIESLPCVSVGFFQNFTSTQFEEYRSSSDWFYECDHFFTKNEDMFKYFKVEKSLPTVKFFKECIHEVCDFPKQLPLESNNVLKYFLVCMEPDVSEFGMNWLTKHVFKEPQFTLLLFVKQNDTKKDTYVDILKKFARRYREEINMVYIYVDGVEDPISFLYTFNLQISDAPCLRAIETANRYANNTRKYKPRKKVINEASVRQFIGDVYYRQLQPYLISEKIPEDWNKGPIITIVGDNFRNITEDPEKTVLIVFYNKEYKYESLVKGQLKQLATEFQTIGRTDIIIGVSNYVNNEYFGWHPQRFPKVILFPKGENSFGIEFQMELTLEDLKLFTESDGKINKIMKKSETVRPQEKSKPVPDNQEDDEGEVEEVVITSKQENYTEKIEL